MSKKRRKPRVVLPVNGLDLRDPYAVVRRGLIAALRMDHRKPWRAASAMQVVASLVYAQERGLILAKDGTVHWYWEKLVRFEYKELHAVSAWLNVEYVEARMLFQWCPSREVAPAPRTLITCQEFAELLELYFNLQDFREYSYYSCKDKVQPSKLRGKPHHAQTDNAAQRRYGSRVERSVRKAARKR